MKIVIALTYLMALAGAASIDKGKVKPEVFRGSVEANAPISIVHKTEADVNVVDNNVSQTDDEDALTASNDAINGHDRFRSMFLGLFRLFGKMKPSLPHGKPISSDAFRTPTVVGKFIKSDRLGRNFADSTVEGHAYAAITPVVQRVLTPVGVSHRAIPAPYYGYPYGAPPIRCTRSS